MKSLKRIFFKYIYHDKYKKALLCYSLFWSLLASRFQSDFSPIPDLYAKYPDFYTDIFLYLPLCQQHMWVGLRILSPFVAKDSARMMRKWGEEGGVMQVAKNITWVCARNYSGAQFIAQSRGPIPGPSLDPGPAGYWLGKLHGSCRSMNSRPWLWSICWPIHKHVTGVPQVFPPWVKSNLWGRQGLPSQSCHTLRGKTEIFFCVVRGNSYHAYIYFPFPTIQEIVYWILPVGVRVRVSKSDVNYSVSLDPP